MSEGRHPYFTSPIAWFTDLDEAKRAATERGQRVMLAWGRPLCAGTRALVERTLAKEELVEYVAAHFVALAADADAAPADVAAIVAALPKREPTPVLAYLAPGGAVLHSTAGGRPAAVLLNDLMHAQAIKG